MDEQQQLLLWRWSTSVQVASLVTIAAFFAIFARFNPRAELNWWARAWLANLLALTVTLVFWYFQPQPLYPLVRFLYLAAKMAFVLLLMQGCWMMIRPGAQLLTPRAMVLIVSGYGVVGVFVLAGVESVGIVLHGSMGILLVGFAVVLFRAGLTWLGAGLIVRGTFALTEAASYVLQVVRPETDGLRAAAGSFLAASSSFDTGSEWLIVLGSVLAVSQRAQRELQKANLELIAAQQDLRQLADRDPLTTLDNRRALPEIFRTVQPHGAMLLFFDLDGFKQINDRHGHFAGDTCLKAFAEALRDSFRPDDHVVRYGGDEFLVVARGLDRAGARIRVEDVTRRLHRTPQAGVVCGFSVGMSELEPGGSPESAVEAADQNMYKAKGIKK